MASGPAVAKLQLAPEIDIAGPPLRGGTEFSSPYSKKDLRTAYKTILTPKCIHFIAEVAAQFSNETDALYRRREHTALKLNSGEVPAYLPETKSIRESEWKVIFQMKKKNVF
jgi:hypothetical protein